MKNRAAAVLVFLGAFAFYLRCTAPAVTAGDSGEFMTAASTLSIAHAPSYPLYSILANVFLHLIPFGALPFKCNMFSAFLSACSILVLYLMARSLNGSTLNAALAAAIVGVSTSFWLNSLVTEVFALHIFMTVLVLWVLIEKRFSLAAFLIGLGLGNHHLLVLLVPVVALVWINHHWNNFDWRQIPLLAIFFLIGFSIYLVLPIRSSKNPPLNWGKPVTAEKLMRTITRKDYGSFSLALGESPQRTIQNTVKQSQIFLALIGKEAPWPVLLLGLIGIVLGFSYRRDVYLAILLLFILSGPFFFLFANMPMTAQSEGILGRFFIMPALALLLGLIEIARRWRRSGGGLLLVSVLWMGSAGMAEASATRNNFMPWDYGQMLLRQLPKGAALFMDGGDDAFYSLAMLHDGMGRRADVELHDRGGLVFANVYGDDFRKLPRAEKDQRRHEVEMRFLNERPLFYSTFDQKILPGVPLVQTGFLYQASRVEFKRDYWPLLCVRSLYPLAVSDYRTRALGAFFPFMLAKSAWLNSDYDFALSAFHRARVMGWDVDWLRANMIYEYAFSAFDRLMKNDYAKAEEMYREWLTFDPSSQQANINLGVCLEREGKIDDAIAQYKETANRFPSFADPVYNLSVIAWKKGDFASVKMYLQDVLARAPNHDSARKYLAEVENKLSHMKK